MSAPSPTEADGNAKPKGKSKLMLMIVAVVAVLVIGGGVAFWVMSQKDHGDEEDAAPKASQKAAHKADPKAAPTFLPLENMVVNLADAGGDRFAQIGITLEVSDAKAADQIKAYLPSIRSGILLLMSQRTSEELLAREGKEKLAEDIRREVSKPLGYDDSDEDEDHGAKAKKKKKSASAKSVEDSPVQRVLFSSFIIQ